MKKKTEGLSPVLKSLVKLVEAAHGEIIAEAEGTAFLREVERVRRLMVALREAGPAARERHLREADRRLRALAPSRRAAFARAYSIYLELVNVCENAYRTHRLRLKPDPNEPRVLANIVYVLTAHPTESRSPENIRVMRRIQADLVEALDLGRNPNREKLKYDLRLAWRIGTFPPHKPTVEDEARHIFSLLDDQVLSELLELRARGHLVRLRTWVGGDKDGHPGVGPRETLASLSLSRRRLVSFIRGRLLPGLREDAELLSGRALAQALNAFPSELERHLASLETVGSGDGERLMAFGRRAALMAARFERLSGFPHPGLRRLEHLLELFPGLVVPLELREERGGFGPGGVIEAMTRAVKSVAQGGRVDWYVRGCVVSMAREAGDVLGAVDMVRRALGGPLVPVIPLFELPEVLPRAVGVLDRCLRAPRFRRALAARAGRLEVMMGYSDTAKRMGTFPSRLCLHDTMHAIGRWGREHGVKIVFFQGAGGSEGRGGGTIEDQASTWPPEAVELVKTTLQGEMVERTLATPEILRSQVRQIARIQSVPPPRRGPSAVSLELARATRAEYERLACSLELVRLTSAATPYARLGALTIGSRPHRRASTEGAATLESLRAIPWVMCWTQTRWLLPVWFGAGAFWRLHGREPGARLRLRRALESDPLLRSYLRLLGFALAKTEPLIWTRYAGLAPEALRAFARGLERERRDALALARAALSPGLSPGAPPPGGLLSDRRWLKESIRYRAPMIHPLNLLQIQVLEKERWTEEEAMLFRETVTGIAAGMLTTG